MNFLLKKGFGKLKLKYFICKQAERVNPVSLATDYKIRMLDGPFDFSNLKIVNGSNVSKFREFQKRGYSCALITFGDETVAYGWMGANLSKEVQMLADIYPVEGRHGHIFYCYTDASHRGKGLYTAVVSFLAQAGFDAGVKAMTIDTTPENIPAQKGILKSGFQPLYDVNIFMFAGKTISHRKNV